MQNFVFFRKNEMKGILYGIGIGPGDPEHITLKAVKMMNKVDIIAAPGKDVKETTAYKIAVQAVPEIADKELLPIYMPMVWIESRLKRITEKVQTP